MPQNEGEPPPVELDAAGLDRIRKAFVATARRAVSLGIDASRSTARTAICCTSSCRRSPTAAPTSYGGSLENRMRFPLEVFDAVRAAVPAEMPVGVRVSGTDWIEGGWDIEQTCASRAG